MKRRESLLALIAAAFVALCLLTVFAVELSNTQAGSKRDVEARVHERAVLAAALIDSLFQTVGQQIPQDQKLYGTATVSAATMNRATSTQKDAFTALLGPSGSLIARSRGVTQATVAEMIASGAPALAKASGIYGLGNLSSFGAGQAIDFAVYFPTAHGPRMLVTGFPTTALGGLLSGDLQKILGVRGAHNYVVDGNDTVLASTDRSKPAGYRFSQPAQVQALAKSSGDRRGVYYDEVRLTNSTWRIVLASPDGPLFASVEGLHKWVPWIIFIAFALVALAALALGRRLLRSAEEVKLANSRLEAANGNLEVANGSLEHRAAELARSNAELEQFASIASHDLQEPLRKVRTFTQRVTETESEQLSEKGADYLQRANAAAERMQQLIEDLLKFSRLATHGRPFAPVELGALAHEVLDDLEAQVAAEGAVVHIGELPTITGDALQLRQLIQNLLSNALKFHRPGIAPEVWVDATVTDGMVQLTVRDNGIGFEQQYSRRIFRVFERLHGRGEYPGTGIGLALCGKIAERHGGTIFAEGTPGTGSTFTVILPMDRQEESVTPGSGPWHDQTPDPDPRYVSA